MPTCTNPAAPGCAYCSDNEGGECQPCYDDTHAFLLCPPPLSYIITVGWGAVVNGEYQKLYGRDVTADELWPITGAMAQAQLTMQQVDALIVAQSGTPTRAQPLLPLPSSTSAPGAPIAPRAAGTSVGVAPSARASSGVDSSWMLLGGLVLVALLSGVVKR